jgi:hypothetical protein
LWYSDLARCEEEGDVREREIEKYIKVLGNIEIYEYYQHPYHLEGQPLIVESRFACPNDSESYAGGSVSSW